MKYCIIFGLYACFSVANAALASEPVASENSVTPTVVIADKATGLDQSGQSADPTSREIRKNSDFSFNPYFPLGLVARLIKRLKM